LDVTPFQIVTLKLTLDTQAGKPHTKTTALPHQERNPMRQLKVRQNKVRNLLDQGHQAFGAWLLIPSTLTVEIAGYAGLDFVVIDNEQSSFNDETVADMIRMAEMADVSVFVRVVENNAGLILKVLNMGADGVIVPHVRSQAEAAAVVRAARYAPEGFRGQMTGLRRDGFGMIDAQEYLASINREIMVFLVIEDVEALVQLDEIVHTQGVDVLIVGKADLAQSMGLPGQVTHPKVQAGVDRIRSAAKAAGVAFFGDELIDAGIDQDLLLHGWMKGRQGAGS
jgi:2-keto-3-deoxy-L-rhamnonate aldolase RhmA